MKDYIIYIIIGIIIGIPIGNAAIVIFQNNTRYGFGKGLTSGIGMIIPNFAFVGIGYLAYSLLWRQINKIENILNIIFAVVLILYGIIAMIRYDDDYDIDNSNQSSFMNFMIGFMIRFTQPMVIFIIILLCNYLEISKPDFLTGLKGCMITVGTAFLLWIANSIIIILFSNKKEIKSIRIYDYAIYLLMILSGIAVVITRFVL